MIGKLEGRIDHISDDHALIVVGGVGYVVHCAPRTLSALPEGGFAALYTELLVREDLMQLVGFATLAEKEWWRLLTSVQGVGAKAGLAILDVLGADGVSRAIALGDAGAVRKAPGVGPKIAARVVNELKDKAPSLMAMGARMARRAEAADAPAPGETAPAPAPGPAATRPAARPKSAEAAAARRAAEAQADALSALSNLGYGPGDAAQAVAEAASQTEEAEAPLEASALIRTALRLLAPKG